MSAEPQIVALGGGGFSDGDRALDDYVLALAAASPARVCLLATATGDSDAYVVRFYDAFRPPRAAPSHVGLFGTTTRQEVRDRILSADVVYVGGGNTVSLLAVWRAHGVDRLLREASASGVVLAGVSAGANCWFEACTTDSCPHYDEPERRSAYRGLVAAGFPPGYAAGGGVALRFVGRKLHEAVASSAEAEAFRVEVADGDLRESALSLRRVG
jgi:peptidase E